MTPKSLRNELVTLLKAQTNLNVYSGRLIATGTDELPAVFLLIPNRTTHFETDDFTDRQSDITVSLELVIPATASDSLDDLDDYIEDIVDIILNSPLVSTDALTVNAIHTNVDVDRDGETLLYIAQLRINFTYK